MTSQNNQAPITLPANAKLTVLPSLAELEVCPTLILEAPLRPSWARGPDFHRSPAWLRGEEESAADLDRLDLAEVSFELPNAPEGRRVLMSFWQFAYVATLSAGGFSPVVKTTDGNHYVHFQSWRSVRDFKPQRYDSTLARLLETASRGEVVEHQTPDRLDLRPHRLKLKPGPGREDTAATVMAYLRALLKDSQEHGQRDYMQLLKALRARLQDGSKVYRSAFLKAEEGRSARE